MESFTGSRGAQTEQNKSMKKKTKQNKMLSKAFCSFPIVESRIRMTKAKLEKKKYFYCGSTYSRVYHISFNGFSKYWFFPFSQ